MPRFDFTVSLSSILIIISMVLTAWRAWTAFKNWAQIKIAVFETTLETHAKALELHASRLDEHERIHRQLIADVQKVVAEVGMLLRYWAPNRPSTGPG